MGKVVGWVLVSSHSGRLGVLNLGFKVEGLGSVVQGLCLGRGIGVYGLVCREWQGFGVGSRSYSLEIKIRI